MDLRYVILMTVTLCIKSNDVYTHFSYAFRTHIDMFDPRFYLCHFFLANVFITTTLDN